MSVLGPVRDIAVVVDMDVKKSNKQSNKPIQAMFVMKKAGPVSKFDA